MATLIDKQTPLLLAIQFGQFEIFMYLLTELTCNMD
jgi:hypothetical protein